MKEWYIDFETWVIEARTEKEAEQEALKRVKSGSIPEICNVEVV